MEVYNSTHTGSWHDQNLLQQEIVNLIYPVGSIYMSLNSTDPATLFGGTWTAIEGRFLIGSSSSYTAGTTGGSATINLAHSHTTNAGTTGETAITVEQMPWHGHQVRAHNNAGTTGTAYYYNGATKTNSTAAQSPNLTWKGTTFKAAQSGAGDQVGGADPVGGGQAHTHSQVSVGTDSQLSSSQSNMPPYLAVYMWRRTA